MSAPCRLCGSRERICDCPQPARPLDATDAFRLRHPNWPICVCVGAHAPPCPLSSQSQPARPSEAEPLGQSLIGALREAEAWHKGDKQLRTSVREEPAKPEREASFAEVKGWLVEFAKLPLHEQCRVYGEARAEIAKLNAQLDAQAEEIQRLRAQVDSETAIYDDVVTERDRYREALEQIRDTPGLSGLDHTSTKKWRESAMAIIDKIARKALKGAGGEG